MDGIHDLGGRHGFGSPLRQRDEAVFHAGWEGRAFAVASLLIGLGCFNADTFRHAIERLDPVSYLGDGYFARWLSAVELLAREHEGAFVPGTISDPRAARSVEAAPRFKVGEGVRTRNLHVPGHTRLPAYARVRRGTIEMLQGGWVLPDRNAHGQGESPEHVYCVRFEGSELWGDSAEPRTSVCLDLFESYLERA